MKVEFAGREYKVLASDPVYKRIYRVLMRLNREAGDILNLEELRNATRNILVGSRDIKGMLAVGSLFELFSRSDLLFVFSYSQEGYFYWRAVQRAVRFENERRRKYHDEG